VHTLCRLVHLAHPACFLLVISGHTSKMHFQNSSFKVIKCSSWIILRSVSFPSQENASCQASDYGTVAETLRVYLTNRIHAALKQIWGVDSSPRGWHRCCDRICHMKTLLNFFIKSKSNYTEGFISVEKMFLLFSWLAATGVWHIWLNSTDND